MNRFVVSLSAALSLIAPAALHARVAGIEIASRAPAFAGRTFGNTGAYEKIKGVATGEIDPKDPRNALITDLALAPRNARGLVEYRTNFTLVKPVDMSRSSGVVVYNVVNRGRHGGPSEFHIGGDPGDGFLYKLGHTLLWSGWQGDIPLTTDGSDLEGIDVPVARNPDGSSVTGPVWNRFTGATGSTQALANTAGRAPATLDTAQARLISATSESPSGLKSGITAIPASDWAFADCRTVPFPGTPDPTRLCLKSGFNKALLYELTYTAKDPYVLGVGLAAMRDVISFFRYSAAETGSGSNPLAGAVPHTICTGSSQSGRLEKQFLNLGFNEDESGRIVCDGMNTRIAGMLGGFNVRFASPGDIAELFDPGADGPLWWSDYTDAARAHSSSGILHRCQASHTCPLITETYGGPEVWYTHITVGLLGTDAKADLPLPANVRRYYHPGTPHGGGAGGFNLGTPSPDPAVFATNPNPERETDRALFVALTDWVVHNTPPPPSADPRLADGLLVPPTSAAMGWPAIPNSPRPDGVISPVLDYDYGPAFRYNDDSGVISTVPPLVRRTIPVLVPRVDADGNELGGLPSLLHRLPLGTYTSWNPIPDGPLKGRERALAAGYLPFARTKAERLATGDPRLSIEERYPGAAAYYAAAVAQAADMVKQRLLLPEDAIRLLGQLMTDVETGKLFNH